MEGLIVREGRSVDEPTVEGFGYEWTKFDQSSVAEEELRKLFAEYFAVFPWDRLPPGARGFDLGCGSGRWARLAAERVGALVCVDASYPALKVAERNAPTCPGVLAAADALPFRSGGMDFGYSLGVLHHTPDPLAGLSEAVRALAPGGLFLVYLYYAFDNRPSWFRWVWRATEVLRHLVSRSPTFLRYGASQALAAAVYLPLARLARALERRGRNVDSIPLSVYRDRSFYSMRTDALDRFGTRLEKRFTRSQVVESMRRAGLEDVRLSEEPPYWCAVGSKPLSAASAGDAR